MRLHFEEGEREVVTARLGLADDASDEDLARAMASWMAEDPPSEEEPDPAAAETAAGLDEDGDVVVIDVATFNSLNRRSRLAGQIEAANQIRDRNELVEEAIADGKISPGRRQHYRDRFDGDPQGTTDLLARLAPNTVPLEERGIDAAQEDVDDTSQYPREWVPEVAAQQAQGGQPARRSRVTKD